MLLAKAKYRSLIAYEKQINLSSSIPVYNDIMGTADSITKIDVQIMWLGECNKTSNL
jgi:hypothetical protein